MELGGSGAGGPAGGTPDGRWEARARALETDGAGAPERRWVFVSGTSGFDAERRTMAADVEEQARQTLRNIRRTLRRSEADLPDVVRMRVYLADAADFPRVQPILAGAFGDRPPIGRTMVCPLADPRARIEIEVTARC
ncbi:enamine deaminase RidA (YjgF/YER057c/UK114 family) [Azospirillum brasilense]|uniref:Enamine deaminase RidA (YjgF/YER057c/UK114 family) n=1 Tax=Azospirillum brasilense TaxID=192 RepID=A0A560B1Q1_AZOBR|nr:Rid family hydrolase [Azospirillum brasilense]TWA66541.1 enamine deaminase RidA (YjgF/YER057c/UK114 family) [Azospirillum brasilense]